MEKKYLNDKEVSEITGICVQTLRNDRIKDQGFPYIKFRRRVLYDKEDIIKFLEENKIRPTK